MDQWHTRPWQHGVYNDTFDGKIAQTICAYNNTLFFSNKPIEHCGPDSKLRLGVNLGADWYVFFFYLTAIQQIKLCLGSHIYVVISHCHICQHPSHSQSPTYLWSTSEYLSSINMSLTHHIRYQTSNLMCTGIMPRLKEQTADELQCFLWPIVNNLLHSWKNGIKISTLSCPDGKGPATCILHIFW